MELPPKQTDQSDTKLFSSAQQQFIRKVKDEANKPAFSA